ncbi:phage protein NinX family protein [Paraburkholderia bonniea]|uniref:phage protein NinX family protein n=1 Tax=Paraburkholderia bonniea TaxID=2152891 RepID=UPI00157FF601|nr:phage protein NinX family protein [Paraburkholderia bonniea]
MRDASTAAGTAGSTAKRDPPVNLDLAWLDYRVARAEGYDAWVQAIGGVCVCVIDVYGSGPQVYQPSGSWHLVGPVLARQRYTLYPLVPDGVWIAEAQASTVFYGIERDASPLVAVCLLRVAEAAAGRQMMDCTANGSDVGNAPDASDVCDRYGSANQTGSER